MIRTYFYIANKLVPVIHGGSVEYVGSTISLSFGGAASFNSNTSKSSDILFMQLALGEGPIYRINPNGPQDIEIDNKFIDDLVDFTTNNTRPEVFVARYRTGTDTQTAMPEFSSEIVTPVRFSSPVSLKSGISSSTTEPAPAENSVLFFPTNTSEGLTPIDSIRVKFTVQDLKVETTSGTEPNQLGLVALVHERSEISDANNYIAGSGMIVNSIVSGSMSTELEVKIPEDKKSAAGYNISILKITEDIGEEGLTSEVETIGFNEIRKEAYAYPGTALAGYAVKATDFRSDALPTYTSLVKGLIVDVPSNYNQPILSSGEVDWRQIEVPETGSESAAVRGYRTQKYGNQVLISSDINIYEGIWDGTYKKDWTENRVWIVKHILVNILGLPESAIDKYNFYNVAQYADAVDPITGNFVGVNGFADGSFRYKPNGYAPEIVNVLLGLPAGTAVKERRFVCGITITDSVDAWELISSLLAGMRAVLSNSGNKLRIIVDKPDSLPVAIFNETNIEENSFKISGIRSEEVPIGVEVTYTDLYNHFTKQTTILDSSDIAEQEKDTRLEIEAVGCTRKSEAVRLAKYHLESARRQKRKIQFTAFTDAADLEIGDIVSISHELSGMSYGFGGQVFSNSNSGTSNVFLEHYSYPSITGSLFTSNTNPLVLKIFRQENNNLDYYLVSNSDYNLISTGNVSSGVDVIDVSIVQRLDVSNRSFFANTQFSTVTAPQKGDLWALGEINPAYLYEDSSSKLFRVDSLSFLNEGKTDLVVSEYDSSILEVVDNSTKFIESVRGSSLNYVTPPVPLTGIKSIPSKTNEGIVSYNLLVSTSSDTTNYAVPITTSVIYGAVPNIVYVTNQESA